MCKVLSVPFHLILITAPWNRREEGEVKNGVPKGPVIWPGSQSWKVPRLGLQSGPSKPKSSAFAGRPQLEVGASLWVVGKGRAWKGRDEVVPGPRQGPRDWLLPEGHSLSVKLWVNHCTSVLRNYGRWSTSCVLPDSYILWPFNGEMLVLIGYKPCFLHKLCSFPVTTKGHQLHMSCLWGCLASTFLLISTREAVGS